MIRVSTGNKRLHPFSSALIISSLANSNLSSSTREVPIWPPIALTNVNPMPPPITTVPTFSSMLLMTPILELTFAPPIIATVVALSLPRALEMLFTSASIKEPKPLSLSPKYSAIIAVEACAL